MMKLFYLTKKCLICSTIIWAVSFVAFNITKSNVFIVLMLLGNVGMGISWIIKVVTIYKNLYKK